MMSSQYTTAEAGGEKGRGNFFAISLELLNKACDLGLGPAVSYMVIASGTGKSQTISKWSTGAIGKYAGINYKRASGFIAQLEDAGLLANHGTQKVPKYELTVGDDPVWLPNSLIMPVEDETPVIKRLRQTRDVEVLRILVFLYHHQNLGHDLGIDPNILQFDMEIEHIGEHGAVNVCGLTDSSVDRTTQNNPLLNDSWWKRVGTLRQLGLLEKSACLFDGPVILDDEDDEPGEYVCTVAGPERIEDIGWSFKSYLELSASSWLSDRGEKVDGCDLLVPVPRHIPEPVFVGLYRLKHRAHTRATSTWWAKVHEGEAEMQRIVGRQWEGPSALLERQKKARSERKDLLDLGEVPF